jgi:propionyl-CoA synthetase
VDKGDRVVIYLPMIPEAVITMLACARLGAVHSVVFGGFAACELAARIDDARPSVVVSASCAIEPSRIVEYKPMLDAAIETCAHPPRSCVEEGAICIGLPLPPGTLPTLWGDDDRYQASYLSEHPGYYLTGDGGHVDEDGCLFVMGRIDDVINVAGHRLSTGPIEAVLAAHPAVAECAVIGVADEIRGQVPRGLVELKAGASADGLAEDLVAAVAEEIGPVACFKHVDVVAALPKTRSGKILRKTMRGIADGGDEPVPSTIEDPTVIDTLRPILRGGNVPLTQSRHSTTS